MLLSDVTLENLRSIVMNEWHDFYRKEFHLEYKKNNGSNRSKIVDEDSLEELLVSSVKSTGLSFTFDCCGFSDSKKSDTYLAMIINRGCRVFTIKIQSR